MSEELVPEIRFERFDGEWPERDLAELSKPVTRVIPNSSAPIMMISAADGFILQSEKYSSDNAGKSLSKYIELYQGELAYNHGASKIRAYGSCFKLNEASARVPFVYHCFRVLSDDPTFIGYSLNRESVQAQLRQLVSSGARLDGLLNISFEQYGTVSISLPPSLPEQQAIGNLFENLDLLIAQHRSKHARLQQTKASLMQKMFPQGDAREPEVRFEGFSGPWNRRSLADLGTARAGFGFPEVEQGGKVGIPFFKVSDMNLAGNEREMHSANHYVESKQIIRRGWRPVGEVPAIVFAKVGAAVFLGRKRLVRSPFLIDNNMMAYSLAEGEWDVPFAQAVFDRIDLSTLVQTGALPSFNPPAVEAIEVLIPESLDEQQAIGEFFAELDSLITAEDQLVKKLQQVKTALLQKMFPQGEAA